MMLKKNKILKIFLGVIFSVVILELLFRLLTFTFYYSKEKKNKVKVNSSNICTILCLGESVTFGFGNKDSYPAQLEQILNQSSEKIKYTVINKGIVSVSLEYLMNLVDQFLIDYKPNIVVAMLGLNDGSVAYYKDINYVDKQLFDFLKVYKFTKLLLMNVKDKYLNKVVYSRDYISFLRGKIKENPKESKLYFELGNALFFFDDLEESKKMIMKSMELNNKDVATYMVLSLINVRLSLFKEAEKILFEAKTKFPNKKIISFKLAQLYINLERFNEAEKELVTCYENNPNSDLAAIELGWFYYLKGEVEKAEKFLEKPLIKDKKNDKAYVVMGDFYLKEKKVELAKEFYKKAVSLNKNNSLARSKLRDIGNYVKINLSEQSYYHYIRLKDKLDRKGIKLVCMSYPMRSIEPIKKMFKEENNIIFVDNEKIFKDAVCQEGDGAYFVDMFAGDFGHCTSKGNRLISENLANVLKKEYLEE